MNELLSKHMLEATRLTREGKLTEATALLQQALRGDTPKPSADFWAAGGSARIIDVEPEAEHAAAPFPGETKVGKPQPAGARFITRSHTGPAGTLGYRLYIPGTAGAQAMPLLVMLHGCTQSPDDFAAGTRMNILAEEQGFLVAYPCQTSSANAQKCWNWFNPENQRRDGGEPALIAGITRDIMREYAVDEARVFIAGLSAGGAAAAIMGSAYPELYVAVGVHSGLACGAAHDLPSAFAAMRGGRAASPRKRGTAVPTITFHGDKDGTVHPVNAEQVIAQSAGPGGLRSESSAGRVPGGHAYRRTVHSTASGRAVLEQWLVHGAGHAWSGGSAEGSYTDARGPDASREMLRFFLEQAKP